MSRRATISPLAARRIHPPHAAPRSLTLTQPQPTTDELLRIRHHLEQLLARRPLTVAQVWAIGDRIDGINRQLDAR